MSGNPRSRKRKPDHTFKYVQQDIDEVGDAAKMAKVTNVGEKDGDAAKHTRDEDGVKDPSDLQCDDPPPSKKDDEHPTNAMETLLTLKFPKDPFEFLSPADRKLMETNMLEFLKRFAPSYCVPVYKTWTIPKSQAK